MPKVNYDDEDYEFEEPVRVSSVIFGLMMVTALIVAAAAWMGGSLSKMEMRFANAVDGVARSVGLSVEHVSIVGVEGELADEVRFAAMIEPGENMFRANPHLIKRRIEGTRRVVNVSVHRLWPDRVQIYAYPAEPVALWNDGTHWAVIDSLGRQMTGLDPQRYAGLPNLTGDGGAKAAPALALKLAAMPDLRARLSFAERVEDRRWNLNFDTGVSVNLPLDEDMGLALARLADLQLRTQLLDRSVKSLDLRVAGRLFIQPAAKQESAEAA